MAELLKKNKASVTGEDEANLDSIKQIEEELKVKLKKRDHIISSITRCYTVNQNGQVTGIGLYDCAIKNLNRIIAPLRALPNLTQLYVRNNQISDFAPLRALPNLTQLNVRNNQINDLSPLNALPNLTRLHVSGNQISDLSPLKN